MNYIRSFIPKHENFNRRFPMDHTFRGFKGGRPNLIPGLDSNRLTKYVRPFSHVKVCGFRKRDRLMEDTMNRGY